MLDTICSSSLQCYKSIHKQIETQILHNSCNTTELYFMYSPDVQYSYVQFYRCMTKTVHQKLLSHGHPCHEALGAQFFC